MGFPALRGYGNGTAAAGRVATPDDVAQVVAYLASDDAGYVSGQVLTVDGGGARGLRW